VLNTERISRTRILGLVGVGVLVRTVHFFNSWMPTYATEEVGVSLAASGVAAALMPFAGIVA
jgi:sugar phosphate permease